MNESEDHKPWARQRVLKRQSIPEQETVLYMAKQYTDLMERALFIMGYLTAGRITEIVRREVLIRYRYAHETATAPDGHKSRRIKRDELGNPVVLEKKKVRLDWPGIARNDIVFTEKKGKPLMVITMQNRKNRNILTKKIPIPIEHENAFIELLREYMDTLREDDILFPFKRGKAELIIYKSGMNPHFLRDIRLTHLVTLYDFDSHRLAKYAGWKDARPAERYVRLSYTDLVDKF